MPGLYYRITNVNQGQLSFADAAAKRLLSIVNHPSFYNKIETARYTGRKFRLDGGNVRYVQANNPRILYQIGNGKEWGTAPDGNINLLLTLGPTNPDAIGYVRPPDPLITTNPSFFNRCMRNNNLVSLAAHWMHEWMHVSGFRHMKRGTVDRGDVPYMTGTFVVMVAREVAMIANEPRALVESIGQEYLDSYRDHFGCVDDGS
jgi:hypothetical protein